VNTGNTPARNVRYRARAMLTDMRLPDDFDFSLSTPLIGGSLMGPHQSTITSAVVDDFVDDDEVEDIKRGRGPKFLRVWGVVYYDDVFGDGHFTNFRQVLWLIGGPQGDVVFGIYPPRHNDAN